MALGGGNFVSQNKVLPGSYINFVSVAKNVVTLGTRGTVAMPVELDWGNDGIIVMDSETYMTDCKKLIGYSIDSDEAIKIREIFANSIKLILYRINGGGVKATCAYGTAKYTGTRGNDITIAISANVEDDTKLNVSTYLAGVLIETQVVAAASELVDNDYVVFDKAATLEATAGTQMTGGTNGTATGESYTNAFAALESHNFNTLALLSVEETIKLVALAWIKRLRNEVGVKTQIVGCEFAGDFEGVINVDDINAVPWVAGAEAACEINKSCTNMKYNGELDVKTDYKQSELSEAIKDGRFVFHMVGDDICVLRDINSFVTFTIDKNRDFAKNQVIRVLDEFANQIASIFNKTFLGKVNNTKDGRVALQSAIVASAYEMQNVGAIHEFVKDNVTVEEGNLSESVTVKAYIKPAQAMEQIYCTVYVS